MNDRLKTLFSNSLGYLAVALVSIVYVLSGLFIPGLTGKSLYTILAEGIAGFIVGVCIIRNLKLQGSLKGKSSKDMEATRLAHAKAVDDIAPQIDGLELWCAERNAEALQRKRTQILTGAGLAYHKYFDEQGAPLPYSLEGFTRKQKNAVKRAHKAKVTPLSTSSLTCDGERAEDPFDFGETPAQYQRRTNLTDALSKVLTAAVFGYFGMDMVKDFDMGALAWRALYVVLLLALGVGKMISAYMFVNDTYRGGIIKKINHLQSYKNCAPEYARRAREERSNVYYTVQSGSVQDGRAASAGGEAPQHAAGGGHQPSEAA